MGARRWAPGSAEVVERGGSGEAAETEGRSSGRLLRRAVCGGERRGERERCGGLHWGRVCSAEEREATRRIRAVGKTDSPFSWAGLLGFCGLVMLQMCGLKRALDAKKASN